MAERTMKELEVTLRVRNNRLKERREALGMSQRELAEAAEVGFWSYCELENIRRSPQIHDDGGWRWRDIALRLARFHCVEPEELFPLAVLMVETPVASRRINGDDLAPLLSTHQERLLEGPEAELDRVEQQKQRHEQFQRALDSIPPREAAALRLRWGLDGGRERTLAEFGAILGVSRERARQIEARAVRKLREHILLARTDDNDDQG